jgi:GTPase Era involved in 16S rRNA processing
MSCMDRRDGRVCRLVEKLGNEVNVSQKKVLCLNKVDLIEPKRLLLPLAEEFGELPAFDRFDFPLFAKYSVDKTIISSCVLG